MLTRPRWIAAHLVVLLTAIAFFNLGLWQMRRLEEKQAAVAQIEARRAMPPADLLDIFPRLPADPVRVRAAVDRRVSVRGTFVAEEETLLLFRARNTIPGHHLLTPLRTEAGYLVIVDRGWVPRKAEDVPLPLQEALPPNGEVEVTGIVQRTAADRGCTQRKEASEIKGSSCVDLATLQEQISTPLLPVWIHATSQDPAPTSDLPRPAELPELSEGWHRTYAIQWFAFTLIAVFGYAAVIRKELKKTQA